MDRGVVGMVQWRELWRNEWTIGYRNRTVI